MNSLSAENKMQPSCEFQDNITILRQINYFAGLPFEAIKVLAYLCTQESFKAGDYLFHRNDDDGQAFYILCGKSQLEYTGGDTPLLIRNFGPGEFLGGLALLGNMRRLFSLKASTDLVCLVLTRDKFTKAMEQFPELMPKITQVAVENIRNWEERFFIDYGHTCGDGIHQFGISLL